MFEMFRLATHCHKMYGALGSKVRILQHDLGVLAMKSSKLHRTPPTGLFTRGRRAVRQQAVRETTAEREGAEPRTMEKEIIIKAANILSWVNQSSNDSYVRAFDKIRDLFGTSWAVRMKYLEKFLIQGSRTHRDVNAWRQVYNSNGGNKAARNYTDDEKANNTKDFLHIMARYPVERYDGYNKKTGGRIFRSNDWFWLPLEKSRPNDQYFVDFPTTNNGEQQYQFSHSGLKQRLRVKKKAAQTKAKKEPRWIPTKIDPAMVGVVWTAPFSYMPGVPKTTANIPRHYWMDSETQVVMVRVHLKEEHPRECQCSKCNNN